MNIVQSTYISLVFGLVIKKVPKKGPGRNADLENYLWENLTPLNLLSVHPSVRPPGKITFGPEGF